MSRPFINDLPAELLGKIFRLVLFVDPDEHPVKLDRSPRDEGFDSTNPYDVILVSRHWRDVAYATPQSWEDIIKRSKTLPLLLDWHGVRPEGGQPWPLKVLEGCCGRLRWLEFEFFCHELKGFLKAIPLANSLQDVYLGAWEFTVWDDPAEFLTFIQGLPQMTSLGLVGGSIPRMAPNGTALVPHAQLNHQNLRCLYLKSRSWRVFQFLKSVPLQSLKELKLQAHCEQDVAEISGQGPQRVFQEFWEGREEVPRSLTVTMSRDIKASKNVLEIVSRQCRPPGHEPNDDVNGPLLKLIASGFEETVQTAWKKLAKALPLEDTEKAIVVQNVPA